MRTVWVFQHDDAESPALIRTVLERLDCAVLTFRPDRKPLPETLAGDCSALVAMGGPAGVYQQETHPWIARELDLLREAMKTARPVLGICLGAQLLAAAGGANVYPGDPPREIGWHNIKLTSEGLRDPLSKFLANPLTGEATSVFQWHGDTFDLPPGAVLLATATRFPQQGFRLGRSAYGFQFHFEITEEILRRWVNLWRKDLEGHEVTADDILSGVKYHLPLLNRRGAGAGLRRPHPRLPGARTFRSRRRRRGGCRQAAQRAPAADRIEPDGTGCLQSGGGGEYPCPRKRGTHQGRGAARGSGTAGRFAPAQGLRSGFAATRRAPCHAVAAARARAGHLAGTHGRLAHPGTRRIAPRTGAPTAQADSPETAANAGNPRIAQCPVSRRVKAGARGARSSASPRAYGATLSDPCCWRFAQALTAGEGVTFRRARPQWGRHTNFQSTTVARRLSAATPFRPPPSPRSRRRRAGEDEVRFAGEGEMARQCAPALPMILSGV